MLNFRILGTAPGKPVLGKYHSSLSVELENANILIDCGEGTSQQLLKYSLDRDVIDSIIISHYHPDHTSGIFMVLQLLYLQNRSKPLTVYLPERINDFKNAMEMMYIFLHRLTYEIEFKDMSSLDKDLKAITPIKNDHLEGYTSYIEKYSHTNKMASWSFLIRTDKSSLLYTSDFSGKLAEKITGSFDYLIADAIHPSSEEMHTLLKKTTKKAILTHGLSEENEQLLKSLKNPETVLADDGYCIEN